MKRSRILLAIKYLNDNFDKRKIKNNTSKEYLLLKILDNKYERDKVEINPSESRASQTRLNQIALLEFGEQVTKENIDSVLSDSDKNKKVKELIIKAIHRGLISDRSLDSITKNTNKLFIIIKYGEGTGMEDWPEGVKAPLGQLLYSKQFRNPFRNENFTFIRDLERFPIAVSPIIYVENLISELNNLHSDLKRQFPDSEAIQTGPHFEIISFMIDRRSFSWKLSETRSFNSFMSKILIEEVLGSEYNREFIKANFYRLKKIVSKMEWFSLLTNEKLLEDIKENIQLIENKFEENDIKLTTLIDMSNVDNQIVDTISKLLYSIFIRKKYTPSATNKTKKIRYFKRTINILRKKSCEYVNVLNDIEG